MKRISVVMLAVCSTLALGQKVSDYKYVSVPATFESFKKEDFGLVNYLTKSLTGKKYVILSTDKDEWPSEARGNSCNVLSADLQKDKSLFKNKVTLELKDCKGKVVLESKGSSDIKEFEEGLQDALKQALIKVAVSNPVAILPAQTSVAESNNVQASVSEVVTSPSVVSANNFSNGKLDLQKIQIDGNQFILAKSGSSVPFANFKASSRKDVFIVKMENGNTTIGYLENGNIVIDVPQGDGKYSKEVFVGK
ncbi:hypothetical protein [Chryseobacterium sp.]|uniref:hypothetical protein n=1 Tax=Chryseobacterium sp. TaxID=1871047 RepID=UPI0025BCFD2E|nr:hypothetical protein [Chryseobacterium sp.]